MGKPCGSLRLDPEFGYKLLVAAELRLQHLDRDKPVQLVITRTKDIRHPAGSYAIDYLISILKKIACIQHVRAPCSASEPCQDNGNVIFPACIVRRINQFLSCIRQSLAGAHDLKDLFILDHVG